MSEPTMPVTTGVFDCQYWHSMGVTCFFGMGGVDVLICPS